MTDNASCHIRVYDPMDESGDWPLEQKESSDFLYRDKPIGLSRREFLRRSLGWGMWVFLLYPLIKYKSAIDKKHPSNVSQHPASWYKNLAG